MPIHFVITLLPNKQQGNFVYESTPKSAKIISVALTQKANKVKKMMYNLITKCMKCKKTHKFVKKVLPLFAKELYLCSRDNCVKSDDNDGIATTQISKANYKK